MVGGWQEDFVGIGEVVRPLAQAMAQAHLAGERDVVMPQYLGDLREIEGFEHVATAAGAEFVEVVLMAEGESIVHRFAERGSGSDDQLLHVITSTVGRSGGPAYLRALHDQLSDAVASRERAIVVQSRQGDIEGTYRDVLAGLGGAEP